MTDGRENKWFRGLHAAATFLALLLVALLAGFGPGCILPSYPPSESLDDDDDDAGDDDASDDDVGDDDGSDDDGSDDDGSDDDGSDDDVGDDDVGDDDVGDDDVGDDDTGPSNPGQTCAQAPVVTPGTYFGSTAAMLDSYGDPTTCTGYSAAGYDGCYSIQMLSGEQLTADLTYATDAQDASIYVSADSVAPDTNCLGGADLEYPSGHETLIWTAPANGLYYVVVDGYVGAIGESYTLILTW